MAAMAAVATVATVAVTSAVLKKTDVTTKSAVVAVLIPLMFGLGILFKSLL